MTVWIRTQVSRATRDIAPLWPLHSFIAINPLFAREATAFETAEVVGEALTKSRADFLRDIATGRITRADLVAALTDRISELPGAPVLSKGDDSVSATDILITELITPSLTPEEKLPVAAPTDPIDGVLVKWLSAYLDPHPVWPMPHRAEGLYTAWRQLVRHAPDLPRAARRRLRGLPVTAEQALVMSLDALGIGADDTVEALKHELAYLPGWVSHIKWREAHVGDIEILDYLAVRFTTRAALGHSRKPIPVAPAHDVVADVWARAKDVAPVIGVSPTAENLAALVRVLGLHPRSQHRFTLQHAYELHYRRVLLAALPSSRNVQSVPSAQFVACIDPRSEGIRRHLELNDPDIETLGFAGFFGVPFRFTTYQSSAPIDVLPALISPRHWVTETPNDPARADRWSERLRLRRALSDGLHAGEASVVAPYALAELSGPVMGISTLMKTVVPAHAKRWSEKLRRALSPKPDTRVTVAEAFSLEERAGLAEAALRTMGLGQFAELVVISGHGSTSANNLYQSAQHCGACGGNRGDANARAAVEIFNDPQVRAVLRERGLSVPDSTHFVAAEHDTVTDRLVILDAHAIPVSHRRQVQRFIETAARASEALLRERALSLPGASARQPVARIRSRAADWAEVYPEWGLVGNAAIIVGPREMTSGVNLDRRVFLHSYRPELDPTGVGLETILTAPVIVAQWINHQYYFSALNPSTLGAGTKTVHNAIGTLGVLSGHTGDLRRGLPWQSVGVGDKLVHEPMRLAVIVEAPLTRITEIIDRNQVLRSLFTNRWISLTARESADAPWLTLGEYGWQTSTWLDSGVPAPARPSPTDPVSISLKEDSYV